MSRGEKVGVHWVVTRKINNGKVQKLRQHVGQLSSPNNFKYFSTSLI